MRKNVKKQLALRVLSTAALMAMVSSIATAAFAEEYDLNKGSVTVETKDNGNTYVTQENTETTDHLDTTGVTITSNGEKTSNTITVETAKDQTTNVTLQDVNIQKDEWDNKSAAMTIKGEGDTEIELNGDNTLISGHYHAGLEKADDVSHGSLTIKDDLNNDNRTEKEKDGSGYSTGGDTGTLIAAGGYDGAGIGGRKKKDGEESDACASTSDITITGGQIKAGSLIETKEEYHQPEYSGAGIGGATGHGNATNITITGNADVSAAGGYYAAGIGGGDDGVGKNIRITDHAHVIAVGQDSPAIGGGASGVNSITIKDHADVKAYGTWGAAIGNGSYKGDKNLSTTITISGNATVHAETSQTGCAIGSGAGGDAGDLTINIEKNANVTAISSFDRPAIGNYSCYDGSTTTINITGGTVNAVNSYGTDYTSDHSPAIGGNMYSDGGNHATCNVNINSSTGDTIVNAYIYGKGSGTAIGSRDNGQNVPADSASYNADGSSNFGERNSAIVNCYKNGTVDEKPLDLPSTTDSLALEEHPYRHEITGGTLTKVVHNRKYMEKHPEIVDDFNKLENSDLHDWQLVDKVAPTLEKDGYADYICRIDKCGQTKRVVLPKLTPEESGSVEMREVGVIYWDAAAQAAPAALQGKVLSADEQTATAEKAQVESLLADKANWKLAEDVGDLMIHPAADAAGTVYEQAVKASGCQYYVIANVTAQ